MALKGSQQADDLLIPKGIVLAFPIVDGAVQKEGIDLGYCQETDLRVAESVKSRYTARDGSKSKIYEKVIKTDYSIPMTIISVNPDNFNILFHGEKGTWTQTKGSFSSSPEDVTAPSVLDRAIELTKKSVTVSTLKYKNGTADFTKGKTLTGGTSGATAYIAWVSGDTESGLLTLVEVSGEFQDGEAITDDATGSAKADGTDSLKENIVLTDSAGTTRYVLDTDYGLHSDSGILFFLSGGTISPSASLKAYYDYAEKSDVLIKQGEKATREYRIMILPQVDEGPKIEWTFWRCAVYTDTSLKLITESDSDLEISLTFTPLADGPGATSEFPYFKQRFIS